MRKKLLANLLSLCVLTLFSCETEQTPQPSFKDLTFNFRYDASPKEVKEFELILSQEDGRILLDTLLASNAEHTLKVKAADAELDVTTVLFNPIKNSYSINTYRQVNPANWHISENITPYAYGTSERSKITYTNLPSYDSNAQFWTKEPGAWSRTWSNSTMTVNYDRLLPSDLAYLVLPTHGKYIFADLTSTETTVDFSEAGNTEKRKYAKPAGVTNFTTYLYGFTTAGNYSKTLRLYVPPITAPSEEYDLQFPPSGIEEFDLQMHYTAADSSRQSYFYKGANIPTAVRFAPKADFKVTQSDFNNFQITFEQDRPSLYITYWASTDADFAANWSIHNDTNKTSFAPRAFLENLNSKTIASKNLTAMKLSAVSSQKFEQYSYQAFLDYFADPAARARRELRQSSRITKYY